MIEVLFALAVTSLVADVTYIQVTGKEDLASLLQHGNVVRISALCVSFVFVVVHWLRAAERACRRAIRSGTLIVTSTSAV